MAELLSGQRVRLRSFASLLLAIVFALGPAAPADARRKKKDEAEVDYTVSQAVAKKLTPALEALTNGDDEVAYELLKRIEKRADRISPYERALVYQMLGYLYNAREQYSESLAYFEACLAEEAMPKATQLQTRFNVAQLYMATEQFEKAAETLELWFAEAENPAPSAYYMLAVAHYQGGDVSRAIPAAEKAVETATSVQEPWLQLLVGLYYESKQYEKAQEPLEALIMLSPRKVYWTQLSSLYAHLEQEPKSLAVMQLAYEQGFLETDREMRQLAQLYLYHSIPYRAAQVLEKGLADGIVVEDVDVFAMIANSWLLAREYEAAIAPLESAAKLSPKGDLYARLGQVLLDRERWRASAEALSTALAKGGLTDPGTTNLMLGMALYYQERPARAKKFFSRALRDDSSRETASQWLLLLDREMAAKAEERERESEVTPEVEATQEGSALPAVEGLPDNEIS
jgi:tetratricopeptide (TPR) repeat protein